MNELALFAGIGGGLLGSNLLGFKTIAAVEVDSYCREVLLRRQRDGMLPMFPIWDNIKTFDGRPWNKVVDIITAGFPCQPFSIAGERKGSEDERDLWPETIRIISEVRPQFAFLENVQGLKAWNKGRYFGRILFDLDQSGYNAEWCVLGANDCGAPHQRKRIWILAYTNSAIRSSSKSASKEIFGPKTIKRFGRRCNISLWDEDPADVSDTSESGLSESECQALSTTWGRKEGGTTSQCNRRSIEPELGRVAHGIPNRVDRLKNIGNAQVPIVVVEAWNILINQITRINHER